MSGFSLRGIDKNLSGKLKEEAARYHVSVNQYVLNVLQEATGLQKEKRFTKSYDDLDDLFGTWNKQEADAIINKVAGQRKIDKELWE